MRKFTGQVLKQLDDLYSMKFECEYKELIMAIFMQIFSYHYDDRNSKELKFSNIDDIVKKVWIGETNLNKTNEDVGIPKLLTDDSKKLFYGFDLNDKTRYILNKIRGSIVHGAFEINQDGTITINDRYFQMTFEFDCIVDICNILYEGCFLQYGVLQDLFMFKNFVSMVNTYDVDDINEYLIKNEMLKYVITLFNVLPMNENEIHINQEYVNMALNLFPKRKYYSEGIFIDEKNVDASELIKIRHCIAHKEYEIVDGKFILFDKYTSKQNKTTDIRFEFEMSELISKQMA